MSQQTRWHERSVSPERVKRLLGFRRYQELMEKLSKVSSVSETLRHGVMVILRRARKMTSPVAVIRSTSRRVLNKIYRTLGTVPTSNKGRTIACHRRRPNHVRFVLA